MATKKKAQPKADQPPEVVRVTCEDCGAEYTEGAPHRMFCPAHTCNDCGTSFSYVLPVYDSRKDPPIRKCDDCLNETLNDEEGEDDDDDDEIEDDEIEEPEED